MRFAGGGDGDDSGSSARSEVSKISLSCSFNFLIPSCFALRFGSCRDACVGLTAFGTSSESDSVSETTGAAVFSRVFRGAFLGFGFDFDLGTTGVGFTAGAS